MPSDRAARSALRGGACVAWLQTIFCRVHPLLLHRTGGSDRIGHLAGAVDVWPLPAAGWKQTKKGYKYGDKARANGSIVSGVIAGGKLTVTAKGAGIFVATKAPAPAVCGGL